MILITTFGDVVCFTVILYFLELKLGGNARYSVSKLAGCSIYTFRQKYIKQQEINVFSVFMRVNKCF